MRQSPDFTPRPCGACGSSFEGRKRTRTCPECKRKHERAREARYKPKAALTQARRYKTCRVCGQVDNIACASCRERMQGRKHKDGIRQAMRSAGLTTTQDPTYARRYNLLRHFGMTLEQYDALLASQGGVCAICGRPPKTQRLHVDHDHKTKEIRGLLCFRCNRMLDYAMTVPLLKAAIVYVERVRRANG